MRRESHHQLGIYLIREYMPKHPSAQAAFFLIGCVQPDKNPTTYLKGSLRGQWLRGHNYRNSRRFMTRICRRLENRTRLCLFDYYTLGKLMHYTADAFTYAHNSNFLSSLRIHREYEQSLQEYFLDFLYHDPKIPVTAKPTLMEIIAACHREYSSQKPHIHLDAQYTLMVCRCILTHLSEKQLLSAKV